MEIVGDFMEENILKLIKRYENKIEYLETHILPSNEELHKGMIEAFEQAIYDLRDLLDGIDM